MKAKIFQSKAKHNAYSMDGKREEVNRIRVVITHKGKLHTLADARLYMGRSSRSSVVYCSVWLGNSGALYDAKTAGADIATSGRGDAGGWGYHKQSAALGSALSAAGVELYGSPYSVQRWDYDKKREKTPAELRAEQRKANKTRAYINGVGDSAMREAMRAVGEELKRVGKLRGKIHVI